MSRLLRGVTAQLLLLTVLPLTVILAVISFGSISMHQQAMRRLVSERDIRAAVATASSVGAFLQHKADLLGLLAESAARETQPADALTTDADITDKFPGGVALYDENGSLLAGSTAAAQLAQPASGSATPGIAVITDTSIARVSVWGDALVLRAQDHTRRVTAVGVLPVRALQFNALVNPLNENSTLDAFLFGTDGWALAHTKPERVGDNVRDHPGVVEALRGQSGGLFRPDPASGEEHVVSYAPVVTSHGDTGLGVLLEEPWETVLDPLMRYSLAMPLITLPVLLLAMLAVMFGLRRIVQPLQQLDRQARDIGKGQYAVLRQPVHGIEEIQQLQNTLRVMADQIQADQERLRSYANAITETQEAERKRLARELHDDTIQSLIVLSQRIQVMRQAAARDQPQTAAKLEDLRAVVLRMIEDVRRFSRALRPIYLEDAGLTAALERLAVEANVTAQHRAPGVPVYTVAFNTSGSVARLKPEVELALFRIAQEALANALRHASPSRVSITLDALPGRGLQLRVEDDGQGFAEPSTPVGGVPAPVTTTPHDIAGGTAGGFGLMGIRERALLVGADVDIQSRPGKGTRIAVTYGA